MGSELSDQIRNAVEATMRKIAVIFGQIFDKNWSMQKRILKSVSTMRPKN